MRIGIACEDDNHFRVTTILARGAATQVHTWLEDSFENVVVWCGLTEDEPWHCISKTDAYDVRPISLDGIRIQPQGLIAGSRLHPEASMWRKVLLLFAHANPRPDAVILVRDSDGDARRLNGINQVRRDLPWPFPIIAAFPDPEVEAWVVCGFEPQDTGEREVLRRLQRDLSFNPTLESHRLTAHPNDAQRDAKRVLKGLCLDVRSREDQCLENRERLMERGRDNGLSAFMEEVDTNLVPLFGAHDWPS